ncbi:hypothetical protein PPERSA_07955 [Pseudocohnilembus persalinus]|uniref:Uncharacterized protein n=1 Tax=Pseudocohnilembus persalinus TaxID=266149 RepID=A0A0V0QB72_PSEPJ|nr:hypothetical protein PPERSA_07955 [Pseudocohnilembus persalinus]|eukprot:KRW99470.1 hypothetical protein PPERSA_07955 [Pseudocohnilembus persalinus]
MKTVKQFDELQSKLTEIKPIQSTIYNLKQDIDNYQIDNNYDMQIFPIFKQEEMELEGLVDDFLKDIYNINDIDKGKQKMQNSVELRQIHKKENNDSEESLHSENYNENEQQNSQYNNINKNNNQMDIIE